MRVVFSRQIRIFSEETVIKIRCHIKSYVITNINGGLCSMVTAQEVAPRRQIQVSCFKRVPSVLQFCSTASPTRTYTLYTVYTLNEQQLATARSCVRTADRSPLIDDFLTPRLLLDFVFVVRTGVLKNIEQNRVNRTYRRAFCPKLTLLFLGGGSPPKGGEC